MTLGDIIKDYRKTHHLSMDAFSEKSGISKAYISLLEKSKHPKTGKPIAPSIQYIRQAADGMEMDFNTLFSMIDGNVSLNEGVSPYPDLSPRDEKDIEKALQDTLNQLESEQNGLMFSGQALDDETRELLKISLENSLRMAKITAKKKFTPKKYRADEE